MNNKFTKEFFRAIPKTDLHCHLDGSLRLSTALELGRGTGITKANTEEELVREFGLGERHDSLLEYLKAFEFTTSIMQTEENLRRITRELIEDALAENIVHIEVRYAPMLHTNGGLTESEVHRIVCDELVSASFNTGVSVAVIVCGLRHLEPWQILKDAAIAADYSSRIPTGFDLAGPENGFPPSRHTQAIEFARRFGLFITIHAGEAAGAESVWDAFMNGAERFGHGVRMMEDDLLVKTVANKGLGVEVCLTSNLQTATIEKIDDHPLPSMLESDIKVSLCTDNRLVSATDMSTEFELAAKSFDLSAEDLYAFVRNGIETAFVEPNKKNILLADAFAKFKDVCKKFDIEFKA